MSGYKHDCIKVFFSESENFKHFYVDCNSFQELKEEVLSSLESFPGEHRLFWIDKEGDEISIDNDSSFKVFRKLNAEDLRIYCEIVKNLEVEKKKETVHNSVRCDVCNVCPIIGSRYKCLQCKDYDLCFNCENNHQHGEHVLVKCSGVLHKDRKSAIVIMYASERADTHFGITCDSCREKPITGFRYKCLDCVDYDLCSDCHAANVHSNHVLLRIPVQSRVIRNLF